MSTIPRRPANTNAIVRVALTPQDFQRTFVGTSSDIRNRSSINSCARRSAVRRSITAMTTCYDTTVINIRIPARFSVQDQRLPHALVMACLPRAATWLSRLCRIKHLAPRCLRSTCVSIQVSSSPASRSNVLSSRGKLGGAISEGRLHP